ncbi:SusC/RagA family TonB-linked outer membrane protein [Flavitalea sp. BT771]|uniref:SusC/RagA family TonB-linked outer membrane protein n=1 Tax=Flavitalea sp. BT771 TaxID=3063329 RepID=UPI0026E40090|nr:SusC/RagA family TonB-linked outer membrane protein [Flavitalea sp. BT771]MDO6431263.1 SusC/RagA family TonB-linked outer membrane protein [Flavitalea sp. BT771]MDV6220171.1 SusC/RagA family TonB-linked outer membrane protein [Flavitalea sp. BT771]
MKRFHPKVLGSLLICCLLAIPASHAQAQDAKSLRINGTVRSVSDGLPIAGATVVLVANKKIATATDASGSFTLVIPADVTARTLEISSIGFSSKQVEVQPGQAVLSITLEGSRSSLNEVVVTALGISRQKKSLGYSVTEVKGSEFTQARENNIANALTGKVAGVNAVGISTGPGGSSRVTIRGNGSFGENQPLYVVNGMPIDNSVPGGAPTVNGITFNVDRGDGIGDINPDDIESITVLKGGTASALYGSRASNGVILITTKKGRTQKGVGLEYNTTGTLENVAVIPDYQFEYGQGDGGKKPTDIGASRNTGRRSWGAKIDGSTDYVGVDGKTHPYTAQKNNFQNYYHTGKTLTNTIALSGGNEFTTYRFSASDLNSKGILPRTTIDRKTFNLAVNSRLTDKLSLDALAQYNLEVGHNRTSAGDALGNPNWVPLEIANTADVRWLAPGYDSLGNETPWNDAPIASNGYFVQNKFQENDTKNRFLGQASLSYKLLPNLVFKGTVSRDFYNYNYTNIMPTGTLYVLTGQYAGVKSDVSETNALFTTTYNTRVGDDFGIAVMGGANSRKFRNQQLTLSGLNFTIPYFYSFTNLSTSSVTPFTSHLTTNSAFGSVDLDYKSLFFLSFTGRKDWFSTLSPKHYGVFYPSIGGSFILSDAVSLPAIFNLAKIRGSWAKVGGGAPDPYAINLTYSSVPSSGQPLQSVTPDPNAFTNIISNPDLKPFTSTTYEAGFELSMLNHRLGLDVTYYNRKTTNEILPTTISTTSGYSAAYLNIGQLNNKGIEMLLTGTPIKMGDFSWNVSYNVAYNNNKVIQLAPGLTSFPVAQSVNGYTTLQHIVGQPFGMLVGTSMLKNANGDTVFNATSGLPVIAPSHNLGKSVAPWTMGLTNEFHYKRFGFSFLIDGKFGNKIFSIFEVYATRMGKLKSTLKGRENGLTVNGVDQAGNKYARTVPISGLRVYYDNYKTYSDLFVHDGSFVKLRQVIASYNLPISKWHLGRLQSANIGFVARNLFILYRKTKNFDPEQSLTNSNAQGFESIGLPRTRSYGLNLSLKF